MRDALYAGYSAAMTAAKTARTTTMISTAHGIVTPSMKLLGTAYGQRQTDQRADHDADDDAEHGDDHRLPPHGAPQLASVHADRPQQPDLARALEDRQRERDRDAEERDHDREREQHRDDDEQLVDLTLLVLAELGVGLHLGLRELLDRLLDLLLGDVGIDAVLGAGEHELVDGRLIGDLGEQTGRDPAAGCRASCPRRCRRR